MISNEKNYDISLSNEDYPQTELISVKLNNFIDKQNNDHNKNNIELTEFRENCDDEEESNILEQLTNPRKDAKSLSVQNQDKKTIKYRKGNLYIIYNKNGNPKIVIGPDCKYLLIF